jgi:peptidyl-prolyl cis-trans isomerase SurA
MRFLRLASHSDRVLLLVPVALAIGVATGCKSTPATPPPPAISADAWAVVDGREITRDFVDKAYRRMGGNTQPLSDEETAAAKLNLLNDLIVQDVLVTKASALKVEVPEADLDKAFNAAKSNIPDEQFQQELKNRNLTVADMRDGLKRELLSQKVIEHEVQAKIAVSDQEVSAFFDANRARFNFPEEAYHIAQIVITPVREQQQANRSGDDATSPQAAAAKAQMIMERLKAGSPFSDLATEYSEDPQSAQRGGDLGFVPVSKLRGAPPKLRDAVLKKEPGNVSLVSEGGAFTIVLIVAHEQAGQRDLSTPAVKETITNALKDRKEQLLRAAYLTAVRSDAKVDNIYARKLVEAQGKVPTLVATPAKPTK